MRFMIRSSRVSTALLTLFPLAALVSKYGILQKAKNKLKSQFIITGEEQNQYMNTAIYLKITLTLLLLLHN